MDNNIKQIGVFTVSSKIAFDIECNPDIVWKALWPEEFSQYELPEGWHLEETTRRQACMTQAVFRVEGFATIEDAQEVADILKRI